MFYQNKFWKLVNNGNESFSYWEDDDGERLGPYWADTVAQSWAVRHGGKII